ncbi:ATP-binding cassette domain-containing protein [Aquimarina sp. U1-2]|uniref:sulfate/molybdate ABC transporter ATP-binding protein n=1 Tax=Aquimarina sp. U1-2 TaxID=2823141 RepID=UPI001AEC78AB|nr:ATP-binding cassette domain-containing protein [Aquimarina sp. U1-2]MBP2834130.1 ATP-binding cassette domain-containing protein [Aquimarina sp. U1-2]
MITVSLYKILHAAQGSMPLDIEITIEPGQFITLYGASGAGKTSILRMISGLFTPDHGKIIGNHKTWFDSVNKINLSAQQRNVGFVFQEYALFPNMTVRKNIAYALGKNQDPAIVEELIDLVGLKELQHVKPDTLSGGQRQRVALARALVQKPKILLLDEPLSALDTNMRQQLQNYMLTIHKRFDLTTILVSHDMGEVMKLSDYMYVLDQGKIIKSGTPTDIFTPRHMDTKFYCTGEIVDIAYEQVSCKITILQGANLTQMFVKKSDIVNIRIGDMVQVISNSFDPIIQKIL